MFNTHYRGRLKLNIVTEIHIKKLKANDEEIKAKKDSGSTNSTSANSKLRPPNIK